MKFFVEVLIEKSAITYDQLCEAFVLQSSKQPSILELAHKSKLLSSDQLVAVCLHQAKHPSSFREACESLGFWSESLQAYLDKATMSEVPSVVEILRERGHLTSDSIVGILETMSAPMADSDVPVITANMEKVTELAMEPEPVSAVMVEAPQGNQDNQDNSELVAGASFVEFLGDDLRAQIQQAQTDLKATCADAQGWAELGTTLFHAYHQIKGASRFLGEVLLERLADQAESLLDFVSKTDASSATTTRETVVSTLDLISVAVWKIRDCRAQDRALPPELISIADRACDFAVKVAEQLKLVQAQAA